MLVNDKNGVSSYELHRALGISQKSAWFVLHRLRTALKYKSLDKIGNDSGPVEIDETYIGPNTRKMHADRRLKLQTASYAKAKMTVVGMLDRESRQIRAKVVPNVRRETLQNEILEQIERGTKIYTDQWPAYDGLTAEQYIHETVNHMKEYVRGEVHTQGIENFWALLKRTLRGTYVAVEPYHLERYVDEQIFRFNNRATKDNPLNDADRFVTALSMVAGKRLTFKELTGKSGSHTNA
jgi:transposase-like protein